MSAADAILIQGLEFYGYHGVPDAEQATGHRYRVDVRLTVDTAQAGAEDDVGETVDYSAVTACLLEIGAGRRLRLVEALAARMCEAVLSRFPKVQEVQLRVEKLLPPMNAIVASVGVEIIRTR